MTIGGKIERVYFGAKAIFVAPLLLWMYLEGDNRLFPQFAALFLVYALINLLIYWMTTKRWIKGSATYFPLTLVDSLFILFAMAYYGPGAQHYYTIFYYLIAMLSLFRPLSRLILMACGFTLALVLLSIPPINNMPITEIFFKSFYIWLIGGIGYIISHYITSSEKRYLKTLDMLNERTWELESSQGMLENLYETTRAFSSILDIDQLLKEVLAVANDILEVYRCTVLLIEPSTKSLCNYGEVIKGKKAIYNPPKIFLDKSIGDLASHMATSINERLIINVDDSRRILELPLVSHGKVIGLLQIEPKKKQDILERERKNFTIFANSTAVALDNALLHMKMQELTIIDELTGLYNYRYFRLKLIDEIRRSDRYHQQLTLLMIDVDFFKNINDTQGHQTGNIILQELVSLIKHSVRDVDIVARYGGEEFVVILPQTGLKNALAIADRMRLQVARSFFTNAQGQRDVRVTVSIGVASYPDGLNNVEQLLEKVDQALYKAKNGGRNMICTAGQIEEEPVKKFSG